MDNAGYVIEGADAHNVVNMIHHMGHYLIGPGFAGFIAWIEQGYPHARAAGLSDEAVRENLNQLIAKFH
jgi:hypothetical protein